MQASYASPVSSLITPPPAADVDKETVTNPPTEAVAAANAPEEKGQRQLVSQQSRGTKQHCQQILGKNKGTLPAHIQQMFDDADKAPRGKVQKARNEIIDHLFEKNKDGKWEMVVNAPFFEQAKRRCYNYRDAT